jgi:hypothetical protein
MLIDQAGNQKAVLVRGEQKSLQTDRVVLTLGPDAESDVVRRIYRLFVHDAHTEAQIAQMLNAQGLITDLGRPWTRGRGERVGARCLPLRRPRGILQLRQSSAAQGGSLMTVQHPQKLEMIPIDKIVTINPRVRNRRHTGRSWTT